MCRCGVDESDPRIQAAITELKDLILARFPEAEFSTYRGEDPDGIYLKSVVDIDDLDEVMNVVIDRVLDIEIDRELPVYVVMSKPLRRTVAELRNRKKRGVTPLPEFMTR